MLQQRTKGQDLSKVFDIPYALKKLSELDTIQDKIELNNYKNLAEKEAYFPQVFLRNKVFTV